MLKDFTFLSVSLIFSQSDSLKWKHYGRIGLSNAQSQMELWILQLQED